jgi:hypothetical protein
MTGFGSFGFSGFSLCTALFDVGELRRRNTEENPWLAVSVGLKSKTEGLQVCMPQRLDDLPRSSFGYQSGKQL